MNVSGLSRLFVYETRPMYNMLACFFTNYFPHVQPFVIFESLPVVGFGPHVDATRVFGIARDHTCSNVLVRKGGDRAANEAIRLCGFNTLTWPEEVDNRIRGVAPCVVQLAELGCLRCLTGWRPVLRIIRKKSLEI